MYAPSVIDYVIVLKITCNRILIQIIWICMCWKLEAFSVEESARISVVRITSSPGPKSMIDSICVSHSGLDLVSSIVDCWLVIAIGR